ncbi:MAG: DUF3168 domain-containing protein [Planctomycetota bacterium]
MSIKAAIYALVTEHAGAKAILDTRIYPQRAPSGTPLPYAVYHRISPERQYHLGGFAGCTRELIQVDAWADTPAEAEAMADALIDAMEVQQVQAGGILIESIELQSQRDTDQDPQDGRDLPVFGSSLDFRIWHKTL